MTSTHHDDESLLAFIDGDGGASDIEAVARHLGECDSCFIRMSGLRSMTELLEDKSVHRFARSAYATDPGELQELMRRIQRKDEQDSAGEELFLALTSAPPEQWSERVEAVDPAVLGGVVRRMVAAARKQLDRAPDDALRMLDAAESVTRRLEEVFELAEQRGAIAKERANALRMLGRYPEALESLEWAEGFLRHLPASAYERIFVIWSRATILFGMTRYREALERATEAARAFHEFGDDDNELQVRMLEATIRCEQGELETARDIYHRLLDAFRGSGRRELAARTLANLAECEVRLDRPREARQLAAEAMREYEALGLTVETIRLRWSLGYSLLRQDEYEAALELLTTAANAFETVGMVAEAGDAGLDIAEVYLRQERWSDAEELSRRLVTLFAAGDVPVHRARAFEYLQEAVTARTATVELVEYVRGYVSSPTGDSSRAFEPPS